jgi:2-polyprenyl-3-methyl-5-hydroxy-6-metoxy-1,4-benzoquinol methylase
MFSMATESGEFPQESFLPVDECPFCGSKEATTKYWKKCPTVGVKAKIVTCGKCGGVYAAEKLNAEALARFYEQKYRDGNYAHYNEHQSLKYENFRRAFLRIKQFAPGTKHLDLGCGEGTSVSVARDLGFDSLGIEKSQLAVEHAREKGLDVRNGSMESLPDSLASDFDVVTIFDALDHVSNPLAVLKSVTNKIKPGGLLYLEVNNISSLYAVLMGKYFPHALPFEHPVYFGPKTLKKALGECGFQVQSIRNRNRFVSFQFLQMTFDNFNPLLAGLLKCVSWIIPQRMLKSGFSIPMGIISSIAIKQ